MCLHFNNLLYQSYFFQKPTDTPMVIIESPEGEKTTPEGNTVQTPSGRHVIYLGQSLDMPQHVAEQVKTIIN